MKQSVFRPWVKPIEDNRVFEVTTVRSEQSEVAYYKGCYVYLVDKRYRNYGSVGKRFNKAEDALKYMLDQCEKRVYN